MTTATVLKSLTVDEYLIAERDAGVRHEYLNGALVAMAGGSRAHNLLASRLSRLLGNHLEGTPCRVYQSDMKVRIETVNRFYYPDVMVCCNPVEEEPDEYYETAPCLIVEVLSPRTASTDDSEKRVNYQTLASLQEYLLLDPTGHTAVLYRRAGDIWLRYALEARDTLELVSVDYRLGLEQLF
jgi:Uma2 family endonuclease